MGANRSHQPRALITGGSSGFGLAMAKVLAARGYAVIVCRKGNAGVRRRAGWDRRAG